MERLLQVLSVVNVMAPGRVGGGGVEGGVRWKGTLPTECFTEC